MSSKSEEKIVDRNKLYAEKKKMVQKYIQVDQGDKEEKSLEGRGIKGTDKP